MSQIIFQSEKLVGRKIFKKQIGEIKKITRKILTVEKFIKWKRTKKSTSKKNLYEKKTKKKLDRAGGGAGGERRRPCRRSAPPAAPRRRSRRIHIPRRRIRPRRPRICRPPPAPQLRAATTTPGHRFGPSKGDRQG